MLFLTFIKALILLFSNYFQHEQDLRKAEHKCTTCHVILDDRKMVLAHKKEFHSTPPGLGIFNKIKIEEDSQGGLLDIKSSGIVCVFGYFLFFWLYFDHFLDFYKFKTFKIYWSHFGPFWSFLVLF